MNEVTTNEEFAERLIELTENIDLYTLFSNENTKNNIKDLMTNSIIIDLANHNTDYIIEIINVIKSELNSRLNTEDADWLGHNLTECDSLLQYLEK